MVMQIVKPFIFCALFVGLVSGTELTPAQKSKVDSLLKTMALLGTDQRVVAAVKAHNAKLPEIFTGMTNDKWKTLSKEDPAVTMLARGELSTYLRGKVHNSVIEMFISDSEGRKVSFFSKTTSFIHKGKPKHDMPMNGKLWVGDVEIDESTGQQQVQASFPVLDHGKPIGSMVLGFWAPKI